ncbi:HNH endonuclease [Georgenia yuyongxinii]|uniref:HNH endonuclease n=1 Tax=Georgenia yuyongxinii TaxID=2589797 RepID=A0A5B8C3S2_9MICO|nr:HNH endonuclease [Georgenia yuyongxinii]
MSKHSSAGSAWQAIRLRILQRDGYTCAYCGREADTVDHIVAKANGGTDDESNLIAACRTCNGYKQDRQQIRVPYVNTKWLTSV